MDKMENDNFISTNSIFDNLNLHVKPMDSSTKNGMDAKQDLEVHRKNGEEEQKGADDIRQISSSVQEKQQNFQQSQWTSKSNGIVGEWDRDHHNNSMGCSLLPVYDQLILPKDKEEEKSQEISETSEITFPSPKPTFSIDKYNRVQSQKTTSKNQCFPEVKSGKDYQPCIWCSNYGLQCKRQETIVCTPAKERPLPSSLGSIWKCNSKTSKLGVQELLGDECLDLFMPVETRSPNQVSNNIITITRPTRPNSGTMRKLQSYSELVDTLKNDRKFHKFHEPTDGRLIDQENKEYFNETFGITNIHPLFADNHRMIVIFLDDRDIMFEWNEMMQTMYVLGINKMEGLANFLYHPEKVCAIMEDTGELVPEVELTRRVNEKLAKMKPLKVIK